MLLTHLAGRDCNKPHSLLHLLLSHPQAVHKVLGSRHGSDWDAARAELRRNLVHAPKLAALQELLLDAGGWRIRG